VGHVEGIAVLVAQGKADLGFAAVHAHELEAQGLDEGNANGKGFRHALSPP
jgi:hypothetical protein